MAGSSAFTAVWAAISAIGAGPLADALKALLNASSGSGSGGGLDEPRAIQVNFDGTLFPGTKDSLAIIPAGAIVKDVNVLVSTTFNLNDTLVIGTAAQPDLLVGIGDMDISPLLPAGTVQGGFSLVQWPGGPVRLTFAGLPSAGAGRALITYIPAPQP